MITILDLIDTALETIAKGYLDDAAPFVRDAQRELAVKLQAWHQPPSQPKTQQGRDARWRSPIRDLSTAQLRSAWMHLGVALDACHRAKPDSARKKLEQVRKMLGEDAARQPLSEE